MKKIMILVVTAVVFGCGCGKMQAPGMDAGFKRAVEYVQYHSGKAKVLAMSGAQEAGQRFKPSDWLSRFLSGTFSAAHAPMESFDVTFLPWSFHENAGNKEVYDPGSRFLIISADNAYNEIVLRGFQGWEGELLFEKRWRFPETPKDPALRVKKRAFLAAFFPDRFKPEPPADARYLLESGLVVYSVEMGASGGALDIRMTGEGELHFDDWGKREALYLQTLTDTAGFRSRESGKRLVLGDTTYDIDYLNKTGSKTSDAAALAADYSDQALEADGGIRKETREITGRTCQVWEVGTDEICVWNQIPLMQDTQLFGKRVEMRAVKVYENEIIAERHFLVPEEIRFA